jgi:chaperonin GroEL
MSGNISRRGYIDFYNALRERGKEKMKLREKTNIQICKENSVDALIMANVVEEKSTKAKIRATLQIISKILCGTLGPYGTTTIIQDKEMKHFATKDGYDLMNKLSFNDEASRTILDLIRQVASNQVMTVGDGSTSAIVVAEALYSALTDADLHIFERVAPKDVLDILNDIGEFLEEELKKQARPISEDLHEIETVAMISTNNDRQTGKLIKEIYEKIGEFGFISTDIMEKKEKDSYEIKNGIEWRDGYIEDYFAEGYENKKIIHDQEPRLFISNAFFTYSDIATILGPVIGEVCGSQKAELVIVANGYDDDVRTFLKANRTKHKSPQRPTEIIFTAVDMEQVTETGITDMQDLATLLGIEIYDKIVNKPAEIMKEPARFIGRAAKAIITKKTTQIIGKDEVLPGVEIKVNELRTKLKEKLKIEEPKMDDQFEIYQLKRRISNLTDSTAVIYIAGKSLTERMTRERLFEDAILASKSAIKHGVIPGGNIMIPKILGYESSYITRKKTYEDSELMKKLLTKYSYIPVLDREIFFFDFIKLIQEAFLQSYENVLNNSYFNEEQVSEVIKKCLNEEEFYNLKLHKYENISETQVINSVDTDIQILRSVISIIGILATSNQMITLNYNIIDQIIK